MLIVGLVDADSAISPSRLRRQQEVYQAQPNFGMAGEKQDREGEVVGDRYTGTWHGRLCFRATCEASGLDYQTQFVALRAQSQHRGKLRQYL